MKKKLSTILAIMLVLTSFVGCAEDSEEITVPTNNSPVVENQENQENTEVQITEKVVEYTKIPNDEYLITIENTDDLFTLTGQNSSDISVSLKNLKVSGLNGQAIDLGELNEGNLYYSNEYNLLALNLITDINSDSVEPQGSIAGEQISFDFDLNENEIIRNESTELFTDTTNLDILIDVINSVYAYATNELEINEIDEIESDNVEIEESSDEIQITELVESTEDTAVKPAETQTDIPIIPIGTGLSQEVLDQIEAEKNDPNNYLTYKGSSVMELFAYDVNNYSMADCIVLATNPTNNEIIDALNDYTSKTPSEFAYFIKTYNFETKETEKHYVFLDNSNEMLVNNCKSTLINSVRQASWTTHMTEENVTGAHISYMSGTNAKSKELTSTHQPEKLANSLKGNLSVESFVGEENGEVMVIPNSSSDYHIVKLYFNNGVEYSIQLLGDSMLQIYTSDLDKTLTYKMYPTPFETVKQFLGFWAAD